MAQHPANNPGIHNPNLADRQRGGIDRIIAPIGNRRDSEWYATFIVERKGPKAKASQVVGVDIGMAAMVSTSEIQRYGQVSADLHRRVERSSEKRRRWST